MAEESAPLAADPPEPLAPVAPARRRANSWVVVLVTVAAGAGILALADQPPSDAPQNTAERFLPPDGSAVELTYEDGSSWTVESTFSRGVRMFVQQPPFSGEHQSTRLGQIGVDPYQSRLWRLLWTDNAGERGQLTELYRLADDGIRLITLTGGVNGFSFAPGLLVLPSDVAPGATWSGEGEAWPEGFIEYSMKASAEAGDDGCLVVNMDVTYTDPEADDAELLSTSERTTWCPGRGPVESTFTNVGDETITGANASAPLRATRHLDANIDPAIIDLRDRDVWTVETLPLYVRDPVFGESTLTGTTDANSVMTSSGVAVFNTGADLVAYKMGEEDLERSWIAHPGGETVSLTSHGDVVLVSTTDRILQSYDSLGRRGWRAEFADVVQADPVYDGAGGAVVLSLDGDLRRLNLLTGEARWTRQVGGDSDVSPAVAGGTVFTVDRSQTLRAFTIGKGEPLWSQPVTDGTAVIANEELVFVATNVGSVLAWDAETGEPLWESRYPGGPSRMTIVGDTLVVQGTESTVGYSMGGEFLWSVPATSGLVSDDSSLAVLTGSEVIALDEFGEELGRWPVGDTNLGLTRGLLPAPGGVWVVDSSFTITGVWVR